MDETSIAIGGVDTPPKVINCKLVNKNKEAKVIKYFRADVLVEAEGRKDPTQWHDVEKELPADIKGTMYLLQNRYGNIYAGYFPQGQKRFIGNIVAWQYLPKPFERKE